MDTNNPTAYEFNGETGEETLRPLTELELAQREIDAQVEAERKATEEAKAQARESALAKLAAIGLTPEEIEAL